MTKRKRSDIAEAAIVLLTKDLEDFDEAILASLERRFRYVQNTHNFPPVNFSERMGRVLYQLLFELPAIETFLRSDMEIELQVFARPDVRIEVLRKSSKPGELGLPEKFERLLADRSLALSCGNNRPTLYIQTLKVTTDSDKKLARNAIYRGKAWLNLENCVGEIGISAVTSCEHTLFHKNVQTADYREFAELLQQPMFRPILELSKAASSRLEVSQGAFDGVVLGNTRSEASSSGVAPPRSVAQTRNQGMCSSVDDFSLLTENSDPASYTADNWTAKHSWK